MPHAAPDPGGGPELAEDLAQGAGPLPGGASGMGEGDGGLHDVGVGAVVLGHPPQRVEGLADGRLVTAGPPALDIGDLLGLDPVVDLVDVLDLTVAGEGGGRRLGEAVHPHDALLARLDAPHPLGLAAHQAGLELVDGREGAPERLDVGQLGAGRLDQLGRLGFDHRGALEDVAVLEEVGLEGENLLDAQ